MCQQNNGFIIVVDVDNKRALRAYTKGMSDLERIWPQLEAAANQEQGKYAQAMAIYEAKVAERMAAQQKEKEEKKAKYDAYQREMDVWLKSSPIFRGDKPKDPTERGWLHMDMYNFDDQVLRMQKPRLGLNMRYYNSIKAELQNKLNLAGAAVAPFRMTEPQVHTMIKWEDSSYANELLETAMATKEKP